MRKIGDILWGIIRVVLKVLLFILQMVLEGLKILLLIAGLVMKLFLCLVRVGTP